MGFNLEKYNRLLDYIREKGKDGVVIAFSGGLDSSTLAAVCYEVLGEKAAAVTAISQTYTLEEIEESKKIAQEIGIKHILIKTDELSNEDFVRNPENRCYYCKRELLNQIRNVANQLGFKAIFEGTNFSDLSGHRPGFRAVKEMVDVYSPWADNQFVKEEIRTIAKKIGLSTSDKPPMACLASRIPFHERITAEKLDRIREAEKIIKEITGIRQLRVRDHNGLARIEVGRGERHLLFDVDILDLIAEKLKGIGFKYVAIDLEGYRSGSMLLTLENLK
ncbi:MAG: ATP-dependent sacrificial sulfur transferase LarE [Nitrososphaeria archaeon]